jgi:hypothetical protein
MADPATDAWAGSADPFAAIAANGGTLPTGDQFAGKPDPFVAIKADADAKQPYGGTTAAKAVGTVGAGLSEGSIGALGMPGDLIQGATNMVVRGINAATGSSLPTPESPIGSAAIKRGFGAIDPRMNPDNLVPQNELESVLKGTGAGIGAAVVPMGMAGALGDKAAAAAEPFIGANTTGGIATNAAIGGISGAGSQAAADEVPDKWKPLASTVGGIVLPALPIGGAMLAGAAGRTAWNAIPAITDASKTAAARAQVGAELNAAATDRGAAMSNLESQPQQIVPGSQGTMAQVAGDEGLLSYEKAVAQSPEGKAALDHLQVQQNNARQAALGTIQPQGNVVDLPEAVRSQQAATDDATQSGVQAAQDNAATNASATNVRTAADVADAQAEYQTALQSLQALKPNASPIETAAYFRQMREAMEQEGTQNVAGASQTASAAKAATSPLAQTPEQVGENLRDPAVAARATQADAASRLYDSLPSNMVAPTADIAAKAQSIQAGMLPEHSPIVGEEARLLGLASAYGDQMPLTNVNALRGSILSARSVLKRSDPQAYGRLGQLQQTVEGAVDHAVENKAALDQIAVRRGSMEPEDALPARMQRFKDAENAWQDATRQSAMAGGDGLSGGRSGRSTSSNVGGLGARGEADIGSGNAASGENLSPAPRGNAPGVGAGGKQSAGTSSPSGIAPLREANAAYRNVKETFDEGSVGDILAKTGRGQHDLSNAEVAAKVFHAKPTSGEDARAYLKATGPEKGVPALSDAAAFSLHEAAVNPADGTFNVKKANDWIDNHKQALAELPPEIRTKFKTAVDAQQAVADLVGKHKEALSDFDKSQAGAVAGLADHGDIVKHVGTILDSKTAPEQKLAELAQSAKGNQAAANGLKRAAIEHVLDKFVPEGGNPQAEKLQSYIASKKDVLGKVLSPEEIADMGTKAGAVTAAKDKIAGAEDARAQALRNAEINGKQSVKAAQAARSAELSKYDRGPLGQLKGVNTSGDVLNVIKGIFGAQDGAAKMQSLASEAAKVPGASDALKRAVQEHIQREYTATAESGASGVMKEKRAGLATFMKTKTDALKAAGLSDEQIGILRAVTEDGLRANRSISATAARGGSDTAANQQIAAKMAKTSHGSMLGNIAIESGLAAAGHAVGGIPGLFIGKYLGDKVLSSLREAGLNKVKALRVEAVMNPDIGHALMREAPIKPDSGTAALLGLRARQIGLAGTLGSARQQQSQ